jgi:hypothetical protein
MDESKYTEYWLETPAVVRLHQAALDARNACWSREEFVLRAGRIYDVGVRETIVESELDDRFGDRLSEEDWIER